MKNALFSFLNNMHDPMIVTDSCNIVFMNNISCTIFNKNKHTKNLTINEFIKNEDILNFLQKEHSIHQKPFIATDVCTIITHPEPINITWCILTLSSDSATSYKLCIARLPSSINDNSEILKLRMEIKNILDCTPGKLYWKDKESRYMGANKEWLEFVQQKSIDQIIGKRDEVFFGHQAEALRANDSWVMKTKKTLITEEAVKLPSGEMRYFMATKMPRYDANRAVIGVMGNSIDITNLKKTQEKLAQSKIREAHFKAMSSLGGMMAHELRTPLMAIELNAKNIKEYFPILVKAYREYSKTASIEKIREEYLNDLEEISDDIEQSARYASNTIKTILTGFHYAISEVEPTEEVDINAAIEKALVDYALSKEKRALIHFHPIKHFKALGSSNIIIHVLHNLLKNALYSIKKVGKGTITISIEKEENDTIEIRFKDTGEGVSEKIRKHIFEPFYTTKDSDTSIGLGLYFCRLALEKMKGTIICESKKGEYTTFIIKLKGLPR